MSQKLATTEDTSEPNAKIRFGVRHTLILLALVWTAQILPIVSILAGNAQSAIAIHFRTTQIAWFSLLGVLIGTFIMPFVVKAAGVYGKRRVMIVISVLGLAGDVIAAVASNYATLLVGRGIAGFYVPIAALSYSIARDVFPRHLVGPASGLMGGGLGLVGLGGPFLTGWVIDDFGFRGALWAMALATALSLVLLIAVVPESPVREERARMDWLGGVLLGGGLTAIVYAIGKGAEWGWTSGKIFTYIGAGVLALLAFAVVESRAAHPLFPVSMLKRRRVWSVLIATAVVAAAVYSVGTVMQLLALMPNIPGMSAGLGWSATDNAIYTSPMSVLIITVSVVTGVLARRIEPRVLLGTAAFFAAAGFALGSSLHHSVSEIIIMGLVAGVGTGMTAAIVPIMIIAAVPPEEQALANGAQSMVQGVVQAVVLQVTFVVMAKGGTVAKGTQFYSDGGFTNGFWLMAGCVVLGGLLILLIPKGKGLDQAEVGQAVA
ncbi:MFS transporter [Streptomyces sp. S3(2020)]|uniref:MFS transporter n=1 Tax=Streptomyces sp. S3(2020) TaxID=2732044 RepID=UPI001489E04F|nr:MFS transporter [Streptomyces sp. S3(2020)]NNN29189.1 MFS transporter [Streptomyces sp. S3(2020)]